MLRSWTRQLGVLLAVLTANLAAAAEPLPASLRLNPLRARLARQIVYRTYFPSDNDGGQLGSDADGGAILSGSHFWWIGSVSPSTVSIPSSGVHALIQEVDTPPADVGCFDCWTSEYLDNGLWGQIGFATCRMPGRAPSTVTFYQVWDTSASPEELLIDANTLITSPGIHSYAMSAVDGTTWAYSVDGTVFGLYDMGSNSSTSPGALGTMCEEGDGFAAPFAPDSVAIPVAMSVLNEGTWTGASAANVFNSTGISGVTGTLQDGTLPNGALLIGGTSSYAASGTALWSAPGAGFAPDSGPAGSAALAPPRLSLTQPRANSTLSGSVAISGTVDCSPATTPIAEVTFFVEDMQGNTLFRAVSKAAPYGASWDTLAVPDAPYLMFMQVRDRKGLETYVDVEITVANSPSSGSGTGGSSSGTTGGSGNGSGVNGTGGVGPRSGPAYAPMRNSGGCSSGAGTVAPLAILLLAALGARDRASDRRRRRQLYCGRGGG